MKHLLLWLFAALSGAANAAWPEKPITQELWKELPWADK